MTKIKENYEDEWDMLEEEVGITSKEEEEIIKIRVKPGCKILIETIEDDFGFMYEDNFCVLPKEFITFFLGSKKLTKNETRLWFYIWENSVDTYFDNKSLKPYGKFIEIDRRWCKTTMKILMNKLSINKDTLYRSFDKMVDKSIITYRKENNTYYVRINHNFMEWGIEDNIKEKMYEIFENAFEQRMKKHNIKKKKYLEKKRKLES